MDTIAHVVYYAILDQFPNSISPAVNFYLLLKDVRPAYQYDYDHDDSLQLLELVLLLCGRLLTILPNDKEPIIILKKNEMKPFNTRGELLGYQYVNNDWFTTKKQNAWFFGYALTDTVRLFSNDIDIMMNQYEKYIVYGYIIPKSKYTQKIQNGLYHDLDKLNDALNDISLQVYPFYITLSEIYSGDGVVFDVPPL